MDLAERLRARGCRVTPQRRLVLAAVTELGHATPEDVHEWVRERAEDVNISTVYRTLELLEELDLVSHAHLTHGAPTYHPAADTPHAHAVCHACGAVTELSPEDLGTLVDVVRSRTGFETDVGHLTVFGRCEECAR